MTMVKSAALLQYDYRNQKERRALNPVKGCVGIAMMSGESIIYDPFLAGEILTHREM